MELLTIQNKIYEIRGYKVMLDFDIALLYDVETKALNQAVKRNLARFPDDFRFQLTKNEWEMMRSQNVTASEGSNIKGQTKRNVSALPYAFTEHGVTMLASVLRSERAVQMNIAIVRAFIALRQYAMDYKELAEQILSIRGRQEEQDVQLNQIYDAIENLLDNKVEEQPQKREPIGFKTGKNNKK